MFIIIIIKIYSSLRLSYTLYLPISYTDKTMYRALISWKYYHFDDYNDYDDIDYVAYDDVDVDATDDDDN